MIRVLLVCITIAAFIFKAQFAISEHNCDKMQITPEQIMSHIRYLASDELQGRMSGSQGAQEAASYISKEFKQYGLTPLGDDDSYYQYFTFTNGIVLGKDNRFEITVDDKKEQLKLGQEYNTLSFSSSGVASGELIFAGYGISAPELGYDDYKDLDVKDKIVLVLRYTPEKYDAKSPFYNYAALRYKTMNAREKGAKAIIFVTPNYAQEEEDLKTIGRDYSYADSGIQALIMRRDMAKEILSRSGKDLKMIEESLSQKQYSSYVIKNTNVQIETELIEEKGKSANVIGLIKGSDPRLSEEFIVVGAHYDHIGYGLRNSRDNDASGKIHNGADDNASGVSGLIELAKYFSCNRDLLKRSLVFIAFSAEELGLIGASYFTENPTVSLNKIFAMLNMDMIGRLDENKLTILGVGSSPAWKDLINKANLESEFDLNLDVSGFAPSDQSVFFAESIPVLHFFTGVHDDYHTPDDDWEKINSKGEQRILMLMSEVIQELSSEQKELPFTNANEPKKGFAKFNVYLGTIPDYSSQIDGVKLMGVKKGSPAFNAGLKSEDVIVQYNGVEVKNIYDYVYALGSSKPGVPTALVVRRNYRPISLIVVPEQRQSEN